MERTFSSPSIFGLPNSSSFTCCRKQSGAEIRRQRWSDALGRWKPKPARMARCAGGIPPPALPRAAEAPGNSTTKRSGCTSIPASGMGPQEIPGAPAPASQGKAQQSQHFLQGLGSRKQNPYKISYFPEPRLEILGRLETTPKVWAVRLSAQKPLQTLLGAARPPSHSNHSPSQFL